jgi:hypothetical protein
MLCHMFKEQQLFDAMQSVCARIYVLSGCSPWWRLISSSKQLQPMNCNTLAALPPPSPLIFCTWWPHYLGLIPIDTVFARSLVAPQAAPLLGESCGCGGMFIPESSAGGSVCNAATPTVSITCSGWFVTTRSSKAPCMLLQAMCSMSLSITCR